jgi:hypothetical protein
MSTNAARTKLVNVKLYQAPIGDSLENMTGIVIRSCPSKVFPPKSHGY